MPPFENYSADAGQLEREIARKGIALGIDWDDEKQVRALAREALDFHAGAGGSAAWPRDPAAQARIELFGLAQLMLNLMRQSAEEDVQTHGGPVWKAFARALWQEADRK
jgi:hypothetical protein